MNEKNYCDVNSKYYEFEAMQCEMRNPKLVNSNYIIAKYKGVVRAPKPRLLKSKPHYV
jgi:hypothetical protein